MKKYLTLLKLSWQRGLVYRTSMLATQFRQFLSSLMTLTVWTVIFTNQEQAFHYQQSEMITYVFLASILHGVIIASVLDGLAKHIYSGEMSQELLKPINIFAYFATQEMADKLKNLLFLIGEALLLYLIFKPALTLPSGSTLLIFLIWVALGVGLNFILSLLFGFIGFVSPEFWGPRFLFFMLVDFTAGKLFPLDILPIVIQRVIYLTPFPYLSFMQTQLFLGKLTTTQIVTNSLIMIGWLVGLGLLAKKTWQIGIKTYSAAGH